MANSKNFTVLYSFSLLVIFFFIIVHASIPALGDPGGSVLCTATHDAYVDEANPTLNYNVAFLRVGVSSVEFPGDVFTYIKFDLSSIPDGSTITGATLGMHLQSAEGYAGGVNLFAGKVNPPVWEENTITWNNRPVGASSFATTSVGTTPGWYQWTVPASVVQDWVDHSSGNHGIVVFWSGYDDFFERTFKGRGMDQGPQLQVNYELPTTTTTPTSTDWTPTTTTPPVVTTTISWPTAIGDDVDPEIEWVMAPIELYGDDPITISARATDDHELSSLQLWVGGILKETCYPSGSDTTTIECSFTDTYEPGMYVYYALAYDRAGNGVSTTIKTLQVLGTGDRPFIEVEWIPEEPVACDTIGIYVYLRGTDLSDVTEVRFTYDGYEIINDDPHISDGTTYSNPISVIYDPPLNQPWVSYSAYVRDSEGFTNYVSGRIELDSCSNSIQDAGESGVDCGAGACLSQCRECLGDTSYSGYELGIDSNTRTHFNFPHDGERELARSLALDALREYADYRRTSVWNLDTSDEYMEAVAYYVDQHMTYMSDSSPPAYSSAQTFWYTVTESSTRGCGNDYCGDCEDYAILRMSLLMALSVDDDCVFMMHGPGHFFNVVYYMGKFHIMDYGELGAYFSSSNAWSAHETDMVARTGGWSDSNIPHNYPGTGGCPTGGWHYTTYYCDVCP